MTAARTAGSTKPALAPPAVRAPGASEDRAAGNLTYRTVGGGAGDDLGSGAGPRIRRQDADIDLAQGRGRIARSGYRLSMLDAPAVGPGQAIVGIVEAQGPRT